MPDFDPIISSYRDGMRRDFARDAMPQNSLWNSVDFVPERLASRLRKRGGYSYASASISSVTSTADHVIAGIFAPFSSGDAVIIWDEDGQAYKIGSVAATTAITGSATTRNPIFYDNVVIVPDDDGSTRPTFINSSLVSASVTASAPAGIYATVYKDVIWLAAPSASSDRIHFSTAGEYNLSTSWDTTNKWLDVSFPITGLAAMQNAVFVFGLSKTARVRGSVPPPDSDFIVDDPIFDVGCTDNRSISFYRDKVIWANAEGIYFSDGSALDDLTKICGMKQWWLSIMNGQEGFTTASYSVTASTIATEVFGDYLFYSVMSGTSIVDGGILDLVRFTWHRFSNLDAMFMFRKPYPSEVYFCQRGADRLASGSSMFLPSSSVSADADGTAVTPWLETPYFLGPPTMKTFRRLAVFYDIRDPGSSNPTLAVSYIDSPEETSYTSLESLTETTALTRKNVVINLPSRGMGFKIAQANASSDTRLYDIQLQAEEREGLR